MIIKQLQLAYSAEQDRILIRINSDDAQEVRCWLTRRMVLRLMPSIKTVMKTMITVDHPLAEPAREALLDMSRQAALQQADFSTPFTETPQKLPLGAEPLVVTQIELLPMPQSPGSELLMKLSTSNGYGFEIRMAEQLQHGFYELLRKTLEQADWGFEIPSEQAFYSGVGQTLN